MIWKKAAAAVLAGMMAFVLVGCGAEKMCIRDRDLFRVNGLTYEEKSRPSDYLEGVTVEQESPATAAVRFTGSDLDALSGREYIGEYLGKTDKMGADVANPVSHVAYGYATHVCILNEDGTIRKMVAAHDAVAYTHLDVDKRQVFFLNGTGNEDRIGIGQ